MSSPDTIWKSVPEPQDFPAALDYLALLFKPKDCEKLVAALRRAPTIHKMAKDLLRASRLPLLPSDNPHVAGDLKKLRKGRKLSPVLLVRGDGMAGTPLTVADGHHRICASYHHGENVPVACRIVSLPR